DVAAKHKQVDHVAKYVREIAMQELVGDQGERRPKSANGASSQCYRNDPSDMVELAHLLGAAAHLHDEHDDICGDQEPRDVRRRPPLERPVIPQRPDHGSPLAVSDSKETWTDCPMPSAIVSGARWRNRSPS